MLTAHCPACGGPLQCYLSYHKVTRQPRGFVACDACPLVSLVVHVDRVTYLADVANIRLIDQLDDRDVLTPLTRTARPFTSTRKES